MAQQRIVASSFIRAPASQVYAIIADYRNGHPRILPQPYFVSLNVDQGGIGAGTAITTDLPVRDGLLGKVQGRVTVRLLRSIYLKELEQLAGVATSQAP